MIRNFTIAGMTLALCTSAFAQTGYTAPLGYVSTEAGYYSNYLGAYANQRFQLMHYDWDDAKTRIFKKLALRLDENRISSSTVSYGRSWTDVTLRMAEGPKDYATTSSTWTVNHITVPTQVHSGAIKWPQKSGVASPPSGTPANWTPNPWGKSVVAGDMEFPFSTAYTHFGIGGFLADFAFSGGTLANNAAWTTAYKGYYHDGRDQTNHGGLTWLYGLSSCVATGQTSYGYFISFLYTYGGTSPYAGKYRGNFRATRLAKSANAFGAVTLDRLSPAAKIPPFTNSCQSLYIDFTKAWIPLGLFKTDTAGGFSSTPYYLFPVVSGAVGLSMYTQCAYEDSVKGLQLSMAGRSPINRMPPKADNGCRMYRNNLTSTTGSRYTSRVPVCFLQ